MRFRLAAALFPLAASASAATLPHLELFVALDPASRAFEAQARFTVAPGARLAFFLAPGLTVRSAELDGNPAGVRRQPGENGTHFEIVSPGRGMPRSLRIRYDGVLRAVDAALSHRDTLGGLPPVASREGSFLPAGSGWYPEPGPLFTWQLTVSTPADQISIASGAPQKEEIRDGSRTVQFTFEHPSQGLDLMVGPYVVAEKNIATASGNVCVRTFFHAELQPLASGYLDAAARYIARYSEQIAPYPYSHFSIVSSPLPTGFGMPSATYLGREVLRLPFIKDTSLGHEVLHNWWGNGVYADVSRGNWSEGLTTFMADYAYKEEAGPDAARDMRHGWLRDYASLPPGSEQPLSAFRARHHTASSAIGYGKSAMLFFTLRARLGREAFLGALRDFWARHRFGPATFTDLAAAFERAAGEDLSGLFAQWLDRTGAPEIRVSEARHLDASDTARLTVTLAQTPAEFSNRVPIRVFHGDGAEDFALELNGPSASGQFATRGRALAVAADPEFTVWRRLLAGEAPPIVRDIVAAPAVTVVALDEALRDAVRTFAGALIEGELRFVADETPPPEGHALVVGPRPMVDRWLRDRGLPARPPQADAGDAQVWITAGASVRLLLVSLPVRVDDAKAALAMLARRLPHLARYSWITFEEDKTADRGTWSASSPRVPVK